jgi:hypothetical protein
MGFSDGRVMQTMNKHTINAFSPEAAIMPVLATIQNLCISHAI